MQRKHIGRTILIYGLILIALYVLYPTYKYYSTTDQQKEEMKKTAEGTKKLNNWKNNAIHLGLDLQGGMHMVLEIDEKVAAASSSDELKENLSRALEVIRNRIDQFGVSEPVIQKEGTKRILVQLPGIKDEERAKEIINKTAFLEFKLVKKDKEVKDILDKLDSYIASHGLAGIDTSNSDTNLVKHPFTGRLIGSRGGLIVDEDNMPYIESIIKNKDIQKSILFNTQIAFGKKQKNPQTGKTFAYLYFLNNKAEMTGSIIKNARVQFGGASDPQYANMPYVGIDLNDQGRKIFADVTGKNVNRRLAIVLDGVVASAPNIQDKIVTGSARITGSFSLDEAKDLALVLRAGALPVPLKVIEERTVGPSLGKDSINMGIKAAIAGMILVVLFIIFYYKLSGIVAVLALLLNMLFILASLAGFHAVLTLPGIAGIILTIGMAVDANVLIFERIREEILKQKPIRSSVESGYDKAFRTIMDANVTTLITALVLYQYGTGPIKGFAVTLSIGIISSMFTAIVITRAVFDFFMDKFKIKNLSI